MASVRSLLIKAINKKIKGSLNEVPVPSVNIVAIMLAISYTKGYIVRLFTNTAIVDNYSAKFK